MDTDFVPAAIVWAVLGIALACLVVRLKDPDRGPEPPPPESPAPGAPEAPFAPEAPVAGD